MRTEGLAPTSHDHMQKRRLLLAASQVQLQRKLSSLIHNKWSDLHLLRASAKEPLRHQAGKELFGILLTLIIDHDVHMEANWIACQRDFQSHNIPHHSKHKNVEVRNPNLCKSSEQL